MSRDSNNSLLLPPLPAADPVHENYCNYLMQVFFPLVMFPPPYPSLPFIHPLLIFELYKINERQK